MHISSLTADADIAARLGRFERADASIARALFSQCCPRASSICTFQRCRSVPCCHASAGFRSSSGIATSSQRAACELRFGRQHPVTLQANNELASILQDAKQYEEAELTFPRGAWGS